MKYLFGVFCLIIIMPLSDTFAKELKIYKCVLSNGTISFQEEKCDIDVYHIKSTKRQRLKNENKAHLKKAALKNVITKAKSGSDIKFSSPTNNTLSAKVGRYIMKINIPKSWKFFKKVYSNKLYHMKMHNKHNGDEASLLIDFVFPDNKIFSQNELDNLVYLLGSRFVKTSKESQVNIQNFNVENGKGASVVFTSNDYKSQYRYTTKGALFKKKWLIQFTLLSNNLHGPSHQNALFALSQTIKIISN